MTTRNWRDWFVPPDEGTTQSQVEDAIRDASGAGHQGDHKPKYLGEKTVAHCAACQEVVNFETGMHLMITSEWRIHIACFAEVLERHYKDGEVIDLTTGTIRQLREDDP